MGYTDEVLTDSPIVYLKLEETSGTSAVDDGSEGFTASIGSGVTLGQAGVPSVGGNAFRMNGGSGAYVSKSLSGSYFSDKVFSIEWWTKGGSSSQDIGEYYGSGSGYGVIINGSGKLLFTVYGSSGNAPLTSLTTVTGSSWHHVAFTANGNDFRLYIDGSLEASSTTNIGTFSPSATFYAGSPLSSSFSGFLDEVAVYDTALSALRISAHFNATDTPASVEALSGTPGLLSLSGLEGPTIALIGGSVALDAGIAGTLLLRGLAIDEPTIGDESLANIWTLEVVMANSAIDAQNCTASLETSNERKRLETELKSLVRV